MKKVPVLLAAGLTLMYLVSSAAAFPINIYWVDDYPQDNKWPCTPNIDEFGTNHPAGEQLTSLEYGDTTDPACYEINPPNYDDPAIPNVIVEITNVDVVGSPHLWYVADPETTFSNIDGSIGNAGQGDAEEAFRIDSIGWNRPLIYESGVQNDRFDPGETWRFIIQDYQNSKGLAASCFGSQGIAVASAGDTCSSGSIIPEPGTLSLLALGVLALVRKRRV